MKLRKKDRARLEMVYSSLCSGVAFVMHPDTALMRRHRLSSVDYFTSNYPPYSGEKWGKITKECGNEFVGAASWMNPTKPLTP